MNAPVIQRPVDKAIEHVLSGIREGRYAPGQRLVMVDLLAETGLGQSAIRDALRHLGSEGAIEILRNRGARVPKLGRKDCLDLLDAVEGVACTGFRLVVAKIDRPRNRQKLRQAFEAIRESAEKGVALDFIATLPRYHFIVHDITENKYLNILMNRFHFDFFQRELINAMLAGAMTNNHWNIYLNQYRDITNALLRKDSAAAEAILRDHIDGLKTTIDSCV